MLQKILWIWSMWNTYAVGSMTCDYKECGCKWIGPVPLAEVDFGFMLHDCPHAAGHSRVEE